MPACLTRLFLRHRPLTLFIGSRETLRSLSTMPKAPRLPLNGLFPIEKPSGPPSMKVLDAISPLLCESKLFVDPEMIKHHHAHGKRKKNKTDKGVKIGQGGTLDPLADGVLVIGVNRGTKHLQALLEGGKEYEAIGLLGAATTTMDSEGPVLSTGDFDSITREDIEREVAKFQGEINQTPPIFSALKMEGKPLYEYARENIPLPRPIPVRKVTVKVEFLDFTPASKTGEDGGHTYSWPPQRLNEEEKGVFRRLTEMVHSQASTSHTTEPPMPEIGEERPEVSAKTGLRPATFHIRMTVSGGTYVRSIVNDIGLALGCGAHVVMLRRTRQGRFVLRSNNKSPSEPVQSEETAANSSSANGTVVTGDEEQATNTPVHQEQGQGDSAMDASQPDAECIPWSVWEKAIQEREDMLKKESLDKEEMLASGQSAEEVRKAFSEGALRKRRMARPEADWEKEVLKRFVSVSVPVSGGHGQYDE